MANLLKGLSIQDKKKWDIIRFAEEWKSETLEWKFIDQKHKDQGGRYVIAAFVKSSDEKFVDCMLATYKLDFELTANELLPVNSIFSRIYRWLVNDNGIVVADNDKFQSYFRYKALKEFQKQGIIETIFFTKET